MHQTLKIDEGAVEVWNGLAGPVEFLVDRADVQTEFRRAVAELTQPDYDPTPDCDGTWHYFAWLAGLLLHRRTLYARIGLNDLITRRFDPAARSTGACDQSRGSGAHGPARRGVSAQW